MQVQRLSPTPTLKGPILNANTSPRDNASLPTGLFRETLAMVDFGRDEVMRGQIMILAGALLPSGGHLVLLIYLQSSAAQVIG